jgi:hypothetical protein
MFCKSQKKARSAGLLGLAILNDALLAEARRRNVTAVSTDDSAGYGIIVTSSGTESAAKEVAAFESAGDLLNFLITQKAGAHPA